MLLFFASVDWGYTLGIILSKKTIIDEIDSRFLVAGGAHWAIVLLLYSTTVVAPDVGVLSRGDFPYIASLFGTAIVLLGMLIMSGKDTVLLKTKFFPTISFLLICSATVMYFLMKKGMVSGDFFVLAGVVAGAGTGLVLLFFAEVFTQVKPQRIFFYVAAQNLLGYLIYVVTTTAMSGLADLMVILLAAVQSFYFYESSSNLKPGCRNRKPWLCEDVSPVAFSLLALFVGFCYGAVRCITMSMRIGPSTLTFEDSIGILFGVILLVSSGLIFLHKNPSEYIYQIAFPIIAVAFAMIPFFLSGIFIALSVLQSALAYFYGLLWFFIRLPSQRDAHNSLKTAAAVFFCLQGGQLLGALFIPSSVVTDEGVLYLAVFMLLATVLVLISFFSYQKKRELKISAKVKELNFETQCTQVSEMFELTPRETEIFHFLALGFSPREIEKRLVLSSNTVKSHISHIYTKLNIHSREQMNDVLETTISQAEQE